MQQAIAGGSVGVLSCHLPHFGADSRTEMSQLWASCSAHNCMRLDLQEGTAARRRDN
jgi:hypothetical protein